MSDVYAVFDPRGGVFPTTVRISKDDAINAFLEMRHIRSPSWWTSSYELEGYTVEEYDATR